MGAEGYRSVGQTVDNCSPLTITGGSADRAPITSNRKTGSPLYLSAPCPVPHSEQSKTKRSPASTTTTSPIEFGLAQGCTAAVRLHVAVSLSELVLQHRGDGSTRPNNLEATRQQGSVVWRRRLRQKPAKAGQAARRTSHADERPVGDAHLGDQLQRR